MSKRKVVLLGSSLLLLFGSALGVVQAQNNPNISVPTSSPSNKTEAELVSLAEAALRAENDVLVNGSPQAALRRNPRASMVREAAFQRRLERAQELRNALAARRIGYSGFQTKLEVSKIKIDENTATLEATEKTVRNYDLSIMPPDAPNTTESHTEHRFTFTLRNGQWDLASDEILSGAWFSERS